MGHSACLPLTQSLSLPLDPALGLLRSLGDPIRSGGLKERPELFGTVVERLERLSVGGPLVLCLDDLQWSDAATLDLVHYCLARLCDLPLAWIVAARPVRGQAALARRLERAGLVVRLELAPLSVADTGQLAAECLRGPSSDELAAVVHRRTAGNPFLSLELLRAVAKSGVLARPMSAAAYLGEMLVPAGITEAIEERTRRLSPESRAALEWVAVLGEHVTLEDLERVAGNSVVPRLAELHDAGFLVADGEARWSFAHAIVRDAIYERLPVPERIRRHAAVVDALPAAPPERLAPHLAYARRWGEAARAYARLADRALNRGEAEDAARLFARSRELAAQAGEERSARKAEAGRALALVRAGFSEEGREAVAAVRLRLRGVGDADERLSFLSRFALRLMLVHGHGDLRDARDAMEEAEPLIACARGCALAEALTARAWLRLQEGRNQQSLVDAERAAELAAVLGDLGLEATAFNAYGLATGLTRSAGEGMKLVGRAIECAMAAGLPSEAARAHGNFAYLAEAAGDRSAVARHIRRGLALEGVQPSIRANLQGSFGLLVASRGDLDGALAHQLVAVREAERGLANVARVGLSLAHIHLYRGELAAARRLIEEHVAAQKMVGDLRGYELWGALLEAEGDNAGALGWFQRGRVAQQACASASSVGVVRTAVALGRADIAREALSMLGEQVRRWPGNRWQQLEGEAWVAAADGRGEEAVAAFRDAAASSPHAWHAVRLRLQAARLAVDRGELRTVIHEFERMGAQREAHRARAIARELGVRSRRLPTEPGRLSRREQQIAQLVAAGQTNAEIAAALYLSPKTVERHITNILGKLKFRSRVEIAAEAAAGRLPIGPPHLATPIAV